MYTIINEHAAAIMYMRLVNAALPPALIGKCNAHATPMPRNFFVITPKSFSRHFGPIEITVPLRTRRA
jgi:hypothetical protein